MLAGGSLFAVWFDPSEPVRFITLAYSVLVAYLLYALIVVATLVRADTISRRWSLVAHGMDLACCALLIFCTEGPASPFNSLFVFALLAATLRWRARGALWTAGLVLIAFLASGLYFGVILADPDFDMRALIIRGVYLVVLTVLLHYVGTQDQRTVREMWSLAKWPHYLPRDIETLTRSLLQYAAGLMQAPRIDLHWTELDVAHTRHASWTNGRWTYGFEDQDEDDGGGEKGLTAPLRGESCHGHLSVYKRDTTIDDRVLAEIVADVIASRLDSFYLAERLRQTATTEERIRLARDLHDGILQSFTGIALRLAAIQRLLDSDPVAARVAVTDVQRVLASEQRSLRFFIQELRPAAHGDEAEVSLEGRLRELARLVELEWDLQVDLHLDAGDVSLSPALSRDVYHIVREGLINAARHSGATKVRVTLQHAADGPLAVGIVDDGRGFVMAGRFTSEDLARENFGPRTLRERVDALRGSLTLESGTGGASLSILLPMERTA